MKRITNIRFIFIVAVLVVATACGTSSPSVHPSPVPNATQANTPVSPEPTLTPIPTEIPATPEPPAEPDFESTLEGEALAQYERLSEEHGLDIEGMARFLGSEMVTEWLIVLSGLASNRFASILEGDDLERYDDLSRLERYTFELVALIESDLAIDWLHLGFRPQGQEDEEIRQDYTGPRTPAKAFAPDIAQTDSGLPHAPIIGSQALVQYARLDSEGRADFEFFVKVVGLEAASMSLLTFSDWGGFHIPSDFRMPLPSLKNALSPNEAAKLNALDHRIRDPFVEIWEYGVRIYDPSPPDPSDGRAFTDPKAYGVERTEEHAKRLRQRLMAIPAELPRIEDLVSAEGVAEYDQLHPDLNEQFWREVGVVYSSGMPVGGVGFPPMTDGEIKDLFGLILASFMRRQETNSQYQSKTQ